MLRFLLLDTVLYELSILSYQSVSLTVSYCFYFMCDMSGIWYLAYHCVTVSISDNYWSTSVWHSSCHLQHSVCEAWQYLHEEHICTHTSTRTHTPLDAKEHKHTHTHTECLEGARHRHYEAHSLDLEVINTSPYNPYTMFQLYSTELNWITYCMLSTVIHPHNFN